MDTLWPVRWRMPSAGCESRAPSRPSWQPRASAKSEDGSAVLGANSLATARHDPATRLGRPATLEGPREARTASTDTGGVGNGRQHTRG